MSTKISATKIFVINSTKNQTDAVSNALAERDQLLREIYGPGYIPESSLATIGVR